MSTPKIGLTLALSTLTLFGVARMSPAAPPTAKPETRALKNGPGREAAIRNHLADRLARLRDSGPDTRSLATSAAGLRRAWLEIAAKRSEHIEFGEWECFAGGCTLTSRHLSAQSIAATLTELTHTKLFFQWNGGKQRSAPLLAPDGTVEVTWFLSAPNPGEAPLLPATDFENFDNAKVKDSRP